MNRTLRTSRTALITTLAGVAAAALAGCSAPPTTDAQTATPTAVPSPSATPDPYPTPDGSEQLVMPVDDILDWAKSAVPTTGDEGYLRGYSGWLGPLTSANYDAIDSGLPAGDYRLSVACQGESALAVTVTAGSGVEPGELLGTRSLDCASGQSTLIEFVAPEGGITTNLRLAADPTICAVAIQNLA